LYSYHEAENVTISTVNLPFLGNCYRPLTTKFTRLLHILLYNCFDDKHTGLPYIHKCRYTQRNKYHSATAGKNDKCDISKKKWGTSKMSKQHENIPKTVNH